MIQKLPASCADCGKSDPPPTMTAGVAYPLSPTSTAIMWTLKAWCDDCADDLALEAIAGGRDLQGYCVRLGKSYGVFNPDTAQLELRKERFERA